MNKYKISFETDNPYSFKMRIIQLFYNVKIAAKRNAARPVIATFPDGKTQEFPSINMTAKILGNGRRRAGTIWECLNGRRAHYKNITFQYK